MTLDRISLPVEEPTEIGDDMRMHLPDMAWIALGGLVVFGLVMVLFGWARRAGHHGEDLGAVSGQWLNEHRAQAQEPHR